MSEPIYAFRRKGQTDFCTCSEYRYLECLANPKIFEVAIFCRQEELAEREKQIVMLRDALEYAWKPSYETNGITGARMANEALAATRDLSHVVLCDAEPLAYYIYIAEQQTGYVVEDLDEAIDDLTNTDAESTPLYQRKS